MLILLFVLAAILLLTVVSGVYVFIYGCVRRKELSWLIKDEIAKTGYGKFYDQIVAADQWLQEHCAQEIYVNSNDGLKLHGLWIPAKHPKGTALLAHGYRSTYLLDFSLAFEFYHNHGWNLLVVSQRAHGKSQGRYITFGVKESEDILQWLQYHNSVFGNYPIILNGLSMGASTVMFLADKDLPQNVRGIIADCGFTSPKEILVSVFKRVTHLPAMPSICIADLLARILAGFSLSQCDTRKILQCNTRPIVMIHGIDDSFVPCEMTKQGYAVCAGEKHLLLVNGADHGVSFLVNPVKYRQLVSSFLDNIFHSSTKGETHNENNTD